MSTPLFISNQIKIHAPIKKVWDILINPEQTKKYMFGCETISDWKIGSPLLWKGHYEGKDVIFVKGHIVSFEKEKLLAYTTFDPNSTMEDIPENYLTVKYLLIVEDNAVLLTVSQGDYSLVAEGERRYQESLNGGEGWNPILEEIRKIAEMSN